MTTSLQAQVYAALERAEAEAGIAPPLGPHRPAKRRLFVFSPRIVARMDAPAEPSRLDDRYWWRIYGRPKGMK